MNKHTLYIKPIALSVLAAGFIACEPEIERDIPATATGKANFSSYVALGNSLTAGVADGSLNRAGQVNSYPAIMAESMQAIEPGLEFNVPLLPPGTTDGTLQFFGLTDAGLPIILPSSGGVSEADVATKITGDFHNLGVPGAEVGDLTLSGYGSEQGNPLFARFATSPTTTMVEMAVAQNPTFFSLWIGNNDVLGYATSGGEGEAITPVGEFEASYQAIIDQLVASNSDIEGILANIPAVNEIPYFNVVPWNAFALESQAQVDQLTAGFQAQIDPVIRAKVDSGALHQVIRGVVATGARRQIIRAVIEEGARRNIRAQAADPVAQGVAEAIVYQQAYEQAIANGATPEIAQATAEAYVASPEGQAAIEGLKQQLLAGTAPEEAQTAYETQLEATVEQQFNSEPVQNQINETYAAAIEADEDNDPETTLAGVIGEEGAAAVEANFSSDAVQNQIDQTTQAAINAEFDNDESTTIAGVIGAEGAAAVEVIYNSPSVVALRQQTFEEQIAGLKAAGFYPVVSVGPNGFIVAAQESPTGIRQLGPDEKITLTFLNASADEFNPSAGLVVVPDKYALDQFEIAQVEAAIMAYNNIIANIATENTFALLDVNSFFDEIVSGGITEEGTEFTNAFISGNAFSLDGVHLTQKGYALVAKRFLEEINNYYGADLPLPTLRNYPTLPLPAGEASN